MGVGHYAVYTCDYCRKQSESSQGSTPTNWLLYDMPVVKLIGTEYRPTITRLSERSVLCPECIESFKRWAMDRGKMTR